MSTMTPDEFKREFSAKIEQATTVNDLAGVVTNEMHKYLEKIIKDKTGYANVIDFLNNNSKSGLEKWKSDRNDVENECGYDILIKQREEKQKKIRNADPNYSHVTSYHGGKLRKVVKKSRSRVYRRHRRLSGKMRQPKRRFSRR